MTEGLDFEQAVPGAGPVIDIVSEDDTSRTTPLLTVDGDVAAVLWESPTQRRIYVSTGLADAAGLSCARPAFAVFVARAVRYLAQWPDMPMVLTAAQAVQDPVLVDGSAAAVQIVPGDGEFDASVVVSSDDTAALAAVGGSGSSSPYLWLLLLALAALMVDIALHLRGRIS